MKLFILSARLVKRDGLTTTHSQQLGYRLRETEDEARGSFVTSVMAAKPGFGIDDLLCLEIYPEDLAPLICPD